MIILTWWKMRPTVSPRRQMGMWQCRRRLQLTVTEHVSNHNNNFSRLCVSRIVKLKVSWVAPPLRSPSWFHFLPFFFLTRGYRSKLPPPPGFADVSKGKGSSSSNTSKSSSSVTATAGTSTSTTAADALDSYEDLKTRRAWDFAISPVKSLPMQAFMLYMSGGGVQIFSMGIVAMLLLSPFKNLSSMNEGALRCVTVALRQNMLLTLSFFPPPPVSP